MSKSIKENISKYKKIKSGDLVVVISGKDKGRIGSIVRKILTKNSCRVILEEMNMVKKHVKPNPQINESGGIKEIEAAINISKVMIYNSKSKKGERVGFRFIDEGNRKERYFKSSGDVVDN